MKVARKLLAEGGIRTARFRVAPDYLIVGGKRCGTTSLQAFLAGHRCVVPPHSGKGTHYFDENYVKGFDWFKGHFPTAATMALRSQHAGGPVISGEASPYYSFHPVAFERIARELPDVRLIFILRDPVDRAHSHWRYERRRGLERLDFLDALDAEPERLAGEEERLRSDPAYVSFAHRHHSYVARGLYADQLDRCLRWFPPEQVLVMNYELLFSSAHGVAEVCSFLGLPDVGAGSLQRLESGGASEPVPAAAYDRLRRAYREPTERLFKEYGIEFR